MARAAVVRRPTISMTSPSLRLSSSISLSGSRAKPRPLSAGGRLATWTLRDFTRSIVSVSGMISPDPRPHTGNATAARAAGSLCCSIFDCSGDFANDRTRSETGARGDGLVDPTRHDDRMVLVESVEPGFDHLPCVHRHSVEHPVASETGDLSEFRSSRARAQAGDADAVRL